MSKPVSENFSKNLARHRAWMDKFHPQYLKVGDRLQYPDGTFGEVFEVSGDGFRANRVGWTR